MLNAHVQRRLGAGSGPVRQIDVRMDCGEGVTVIFGPSGAGKTTILRMIAGILAPDSGRIALGEVVFFDSASSCNLPIQQRRIGYVFQESALFPHFTARQNVEYGVRRGGGRASRARAMELLDMFHITQAAGRFPGELSGGEKQRVALARSLAAEPRIMLLDEPLSSVDGDTRVRLLDEILGMQRRMRIPFVYVTHNHNEAVRVGDLLYVLNEGKVEQSGTPLEVFNAPRTVSAARAVGTENIFAGHIQSHHPRDGTSTVRIGPITLEVPYNALPVESTVTIGIRSEDIIVARMRITQTSARNVLGGSVRRVIRDADRTELIVDCGVDFKVAITAITERELGLQPGAEVYLLAKARAFHLLS